MPPPHSLVCWTGTSEKRRLATPHTFHPTLRLIHHLHAHRPSTSVRTRPRVSSTTRRPFSRHHRYTHLQNWTPVACHWRQNKMRARRGTSHGPGPAHPCLKHVVPSPRSRKLMSAHRRRYHPNIPSLSHTTQLILGPQADIFHQHMQHQPPHCNLLVRISSVSVLCPILSYKDHGRLI